MEEKKSDQKRSNPATVCLIIERDKPDNSESCSEYISQSHHLDPRSFIMTTRHEKGERWHFAVDTVHRLRESNFSNIVLTYQDEMPV